MFEIANKKIDITIVIPTFNRAKYLYNVLDCLTQQKDVENLKWEIIIIDNNSTDNTSKIITDYQANWQFNFPLKYFIETKQGAAWARLRAVTEAKGELIGFLDDDNLPDHNWVKEAVMFGKEHPQAGAWSGQIHGDFEVKPPEEFAKIEAFLAIREHGEESFVFDAENLRLPPAAALVVRRHIWCENVPTSPTLTGKLPGLLVQGDDYEPLLYIYKAGWQIWYNHTMHTYHQIPAWRLEKKYLLELARGCGLCIFQLRLINSKGWQKPIIFIKTILGNLRRLLKHLFKYRHQLQDDIIALFEIEFYLASMMSPFYFLKRYFQKN